MIVEMDPRTLQIFRMTILTAAVNNFHSLDIVAKISILDDGSRPEWRLLPDNTWSC